MKNLFNLTDNREIIARIDKLTPETKNLWGVMDVSQMLAHCIVALKIATGEIIPESNVFLKMLGKIFKKKIFEAESFRKNSKTGKEFIISGKKNFNDEKPVLISYVNKFSANNKSIVTNESHPFFGKLTPEEWGLLMYKHADHHLKQFGC